MKLSRYIFLYFAFSFSLLMAKAQDPIDAPLNFKVVNTQVSTPELYWTDNSDNETGYLIERSESNKFNFKVLDTIPSTYYGYMVDHSTKYGTKYFYRLSAINSLSQSEFVYDSVITRFGILMDYRAYVRSSNTIRLTWRDYVNDTTLKGYVIQRSTDPEDNFQPIYAVISKNNRYYTYQYIDSVEKNVNYYYKIIGYNAIVSSNVAQYKNISIYKEGSWESLPNYPSVRMDFGGADFISGNLLYFGLGAGTGFWAYNPETKVWIPKSIPNWSRKDWSISTFADNSFYHIRYINWGEESEQKTDTLWKYSIQNDTWYVESVTPFKVANLSGGFYKDSCIYYIKGCEVWDQSLGTIYKNLIWSYNLSNKSWNFIDTSKFDGGYFYNQNFDDSCTILKGKFLCRFNFKTHDIEIYDTLEETIYPNSIEVVRDTMYLFTYDGIYFLSKNSRHTNYFTSYQGFAVGDFNTCFYDNKFFLIGGAGNGYTDEFWSYALNSPYAPLNLRIISSATDSVHLGWTDLAENEAGYIIERYIDYKNYIAIDTIDANSIEYVDTTFTMTGYYTYRVQPFNANGPGGYSNSVEIEIIHEYPVIPDTNTISSIDPTDKSEDEFRVNYNFINSTRTIHEYFNFDLPDEIQIKLYSLNGQLLFQEEFLKPAGNAYNESKLPEIKSGIYIISFTSHTIFINNKIIIH